MIALPKKEREREKAKTRESEDCSDTKHILGSHMIPPNTTISAAVTKANSTQVHQILLPCNTTPTTPSPSHPP